MIKSYFKDLSYPRMAISDLVRSLKSYGVELLEKEFTKPRYMKQQTEVIENMHEYFESIVEKNSRVEREEFTCGTVTLIFRKE